MHQFGRVNLKRLRDPAEHGHTRRDVGAFDPSEVPGAQPGPFGQLLLRHPFRMTQPTQIDRHDLLEIHGDDGADIGTIVPGMIVPIRTWQYYSSTLPRPQFAISESNVMRPTHRGVSIHDTKLAKIRGK